MKFSEVVQRLGGGASRSSLDSHPDCDITLTGVAAVNEATIDSISLIDKAA